MTYDKEFLRQLNQQHIQTRYARVTSLTLDERPIQSIEGRITQGSINLDGSSAVRRTCSLSMVTSDVDVSGYHWGLNTKFKLEVGLENNIDNQYPNIIWFPQGIFAITSFNPSLTTNNFTLQIQGKDKMSFLNGDLGGIIAAQTQFDSWEEEADGVWTIEKYPIKQIIRDIVHQLGGEPFHNIIINDLDEVGLELLEYRYDEPMFLLRPEDDSEYIQGTLNANMKMYIETNASRIEVPIGGNEDYKFNYDLLVDGLVDSPAPQVFYAEQNDEKGYCIAKIEYGDTAGYRATSLIYPDDLIGNVGESLTSILDKIKNILGDFEYFYDLDGRFVFQKQRNYLNTIWSPIGEDGYVQDMAQNSDITYMFNGTELLTAMSNQPNLSNLKNDYSVWGTRKSAAGADVPIHMRYAIDTKPIYYKNTNGEEFRTDEVPWQEIIYQMALDYDKYNHNVFYDEDGNIASLELMIIKNNPPIIETDDNGSITFTFDGYTTGKTGYEQYYIDLQGFWRDLYFPKEAYEEKIKKYDSQLDELAADSAEYKALKSEKETFEENYKANFYQDDDNINSTKKYWNRLVYEAPEQLNFWFDFLDTDGDLAKYSCKAIGSRPKAVNDQDVKAIYFRSTPAIIFYSNENDKREHTGYRYFRASDLENMCSISTQGKSAKDMIDELLYKHSYVLESVSITCVPIYHLELNSRIYIHDDATGISGEYIASKATVPLTYNGTMTITATKAVDNII